MHCLPRNVMHYCTNRREDGVQIIGEIIEGWMPDEQFKALKAELEQWLQDVSAHAESAERPCRSAALASASCSASAVVLAFLRHAT